jgi:hypothetical protein
MEYTFYIKDSTNPKAKAFLEYIKSLDFVQVESTSGDSKEEIKANLKQALKELKLIKEGKLKGTPVKEFLDEL